MDAEQRTYLREAIEARAAYYRMPELGAEDDMLTLALAWFRAYWRDRLAARERHDMQNDAG